MTRLVDYVAIAAKTELTLQERIYELANRHGGLNAVGRVLKVDAGYLSRLCDGTKSAPSDAILRKLGLRKVVIYERTKI